MLKPRILLWWAATTAALLLAADAPARAAAAAAPPAATPAALLAAAAAIAPWIADVRRSLHKIPELMFQEHKTSAALKKHLDAMGIPYKPYAKTGLVGRVGSGQPTVVLRSDIDALPVAEPEGLEFRSLHEGRMHACGHDGGFGAGGRALLGTAGGFWCDVGR
jgi:metal-dependent amidase/aminoacylase/carboxypeptidase family protein